MLHKLEKELDDVDLKIGDRWRILDRYIFLGALSPSSYIIYSLSIVLYGEFGIKFLYNDNFGITICRSF
jgi:hypothetical protein